MTSCDVVVVGCGNAGLSAALSASEAGAKVLVLERAPVHLCGGNTAFTGGGYRFAYDSNEDIKRVIPDITDDQLAITDFGSYSESEYFDDLARVTQYRTSPDLADILVKESKDAVFWLVDKGVRFLPKYGRQAFKIDGKFVFWGGVPLGVTGEGKGLVDFLLKACEKAAIEIRYDTRATGLLITRGVVRGINVYSNNDDESIECGAVVLAAGGFQANAEWRTKYLGPGWDLAKVRGTQFNTGDGIQMALDAGAMAWGNWSGCHAVSWDRNAPDFGDRTVGEGFSKHSYPLGIMVNLHGERFVDEGFDIRNYTYARYGREVLAQPGQTAWQVFDGKTEALLRDHYRIRQVSKFTADTLEGLARKLDGIDVPAFVRTVTEFNAAVRDHVPFNPTEKDGRSTQGLAIDKTNWAQRIDSPPYVAFAVTCGVTFTFGGVRISSDAEVLDQSGSPIPGLFASGEMVGGIHYFNYAGGSGLTAGTVFGRRAGAGAAARALAGMSGVSR
jgi:tricarballylate dehydrogenase